jgi:hypothetical protein
VLVAKFSSAEGGGGGRGSRDPNSSFWLDINDLSMDAPTSGPSCDIYMFLGVAEDLKSILLKGDTWKEMG